jgi:chemotaxis protein histidine kinase CheA
MRRPKNWTERRLTILSEIRESDIERDWSVRDLAGEMQKNPLVQKYQPTYSKSSCHRDVALLNNQIASKREELAETYIHVQLDILDDVIGSLVSDLERLEQISETYEDEFRDAEAYYKTKANLIKTLLQAQRRQANILPIDSPKKLMLESTHKFDIEHYYLIAQQAGVLELDDPTIVEGEYHQA